MRYRQRVAIQAATETRDAGGGVVATWADAEGLGSVPAVVLPQSDQARLANMDPTTDARQVVLAGSGLGVTTLMSVLLAVGERFEIDAVVDLVGERQTVLHCRRSSP